MFEDIFAARRELNDYLTAIFNGLHADDQFFRCQTVDQTDCAVVAKLESFGQFPHCDAVASGITLYCQQRLVLLRRDACGACGFVAEMNEAPESVAKRGKHLILMLAKARGFRPHPCLRGWFSYWIDLYLNTI